MHLLHLYINNMVLHFKNCANSFILASQAKQVISPQSGAPPQSFTSRLASPPVPLKDASKDDLIADLQSQVSHLTCHLATLEVSNLVQSPTSSPLSLPNRLCFPHPVPPPSHTVDAVEAVLRSLSPPLPPLSQASLDEWLATLPTPQALDHLPVSQAFSTFAHVFPLSTDDIISCAHTVFHPVSVQYPMASDVTHMIVAALCQIANAS